MNSWSIPAFLEAEVRARDTRCVYCGVEMAEKVPRGKPRKAMATWEHIINDARIVTRENIARCCCACNASKGQKDLEVWLQSAYCLKRGIRKHNVAPIVKDALSLKAQEAAGAGGINFRRCS